MAVGCYLVRCVPFFWCQRLLVVDVCSLLFVVRVCRLSLCVVGCWLFGVDVVWCLLLLVVRRICSSVVGSCCLLYEKCCVC